MKVLFIFIMALTGLHAKEIGFKSLSDAVLVTYQESGEYRVHCDDGTAETVQALDLKLDNVCPNIERPPNYHYLSVHRRQDGLFNVVCTNLNQIVASREELIYGLVCQITPLETFTILEGVRYIPNTANHFCDYYKAKNIKYNLEGSVVSFDWTCLDNERVWSYKCTEGDCKGPGPKLIRLRKGNHKRFWYKSNAQYSTQMRIEH